MCFSRVLQVETEQKNRPNRSSEFGRDSGGMIGNFLDIWSIAFSIENNSAVMDLSIHL